MDTKRAERAIIAALKVAGAMDGGALLRVVEQAARCTPWTAAVALLGLESLGRVVKSGPSGWAVP